MNNFQNKNIEDKFNHLLQKSKKTKKEIQELERLRLLLEKYFEEDEKPIVEELNHNGIKVSSSWDLVNSSQSYTKAINILVKHLSKPYHPKNKEGIVRALAVKEAKGIAGMPIITEYNKTHKDNHFLRWAMGNTINVIITEREIDEVIKIVSNRSNGKSRQMFILALGKIKLDKIEKVIIDLLKDDDVAPFAIQSLAKLKSKQAISKIRELTDNKNSVIRNEAKKALSLINSK